MGHRDRRGRGLRTVPGARAPRPTVRGGGAGAGRICRVERLVRFGRDGPEPPRPSDRVGYGPSKLRPRVDEDGTLHYED
ncbi:DUF5954 family protein [Streptomyces sp. NPDC093795]|uniref:DUF5954 family protein n=1 Tax=Streptomyces sp. NPDC093795 TaxID=3366051 RepID=UPI00382FE502